MEYIEELGEAQDKEVVQEQKSFQEKEVVQCNLSEVDENFWYNEQEIY